MMTAPSTMMPKSMAPRLIRLALTLILHHAGDREEHRKRNDARRGDGGPDVSQNQEQNGDHQDRTFEEIDLDGCDGRFDEAGTVVDGMRDHAVRQRPSDLLELGGHALCNGAAVFADQQHGGAQHDFLAR